MIQHWIIDALSKKLFEVPSSGKVLLLRPAQRRLMVTARYVMVVLRTGVEAGLSWQLMKVRQCARSIFEFMRAPVVEGLWALIGASLVISPSDF